MPELWKFSYQLSKQTLSAMKKYQPWADSYKSQNNVEVHLLIGAKHFFSIVKGPMYPLPHKGKVIWTEFGFMIDWPLEERGVIQSLAVVSNEELDGRLQLFWQMESLGVTYGTSDELTAKNVYALETMKAKTTFKEGHGYTVPLLWKEDEACVTSNLPLATARFRKLEEKFKKQPDFQKAYEVAISAYIDDGDAVLVDPSEIDTIHCAYLPHSALVKDSETSSVRIVFDGSAPVGDGRPLNDHLMSGPSAHPDLMRILLKFRMHPIGLVSDIRRMFHCIHADRDSWRYQRFLWRSKPWEPLGHFQMVKTVFGLTDSPFKAIMVSRIHAEKIQEENIKKKLTSDCYVDDLITGAKTVEEAVEIQEKVCDHMMKGGFEFRKWISNDVDVMNQIPEHLRGEAGNLILSSCSDKPNSSKEERKALGMQWNVKSDKIVFKGYNMLAEDPVMVTKRTICSTTAKVYDPLGLLAAYVLRGKLVIRECWKRKLDWDSPVSEELSGIWLAWLKELKHLSTYEIPRCVLLKQDESVPEEFHIFGDASGDAMGVCCYVRYKDADSLWQANLLTSKSKLAPVKDMTIARKELVAALMASKLGETIAETLDSGQDNFYYYTDSLTVYQWLNGDTRDWKVFIRNHVKKVLALTKKSQWFHLDGIKNPADLCSRGCSLEILKSPLWLCGPTFLKQERREWKISKVFSATTVGESNEREQTSEEFVPFSEEEPSLDALLTRCSNMRRVLRVSTVYLQAKQGGHFGGHLEVSIGAKYFIRRCQILAFPCETKKLSNGQKCPTRSSLLKLNPTWDPVDGLIRVGGRLEESSLPEQSKMLLLLPRPSGPWKEIKESFTVRLIRYIHEYNGHGGVIWTLNHVRRFLWVPRMRSLISSVLKHCVPCQKVVAPPLKQKMGNIPAARVNQMRPFQAVASDMCGHFWLKDTTNGEPFKAYVCLFTCMNTRALHLELTRGLTANDFLMAFDNMVNQKGLCTDIWSDNAKYYKRSDLELKTLMTATRGARQALMNGHLGYTVEWHYTMEKASWTAGVVERVVRSVKECLKKNIGKALLTTKQFEHVLKQAEAQVNSRPLTMSSDQIGEQLAITPSHLCLGYDLKCLPEVPHRKLDEPNAESIRHRWLRRQKWSNHFWNKWQKTYLHELHMAQKWHEKQPPVKLGAVVLICEDTPRSSWPIAVITEVTVSRDGLVRSVLLRRPDGRILRRSVQKICLLEGDF